MSKYEPVCLQVLKKGQEGALPGLEAEEGQEKARNTEDAMMELWKALRTPLKSKGPLVSPNLRTGTGGHDILVDVILRPRGRVQTKLPQEIRGRLFFRIDTQPTGSEEEVQKELWAILADALGLVPDPAAKDKSQD